MPDVKSFMYLIIMVIMYGAMSFLVYSVVNMKLVKPLGFDAPLHRFSESRAVEHVRVLTKDGRQEGRMGLRNAANYIITELELLKDKAGPNRRIIVEEDVIKGSFNIFFLGRSISLAYRNHINILMRISSIDAKDDDPSVLINGHFDSTLSSPGAGDCASCVASMLEIARVIVDTDWVPPRPILFLFNGAEELFMLGSHGFMNSNKWRDSVGASINVEASGTGGLDLVCQSGPNAWPSEVYSQFSVYPMAHSAAQDVFDVIPGDTDYRMFSVDYGDIPSLDIIFILGGYYYHTSMDTVDKLIPGSLQARGENLLRLLKAFSNSSKLQNAAGRKNLQHVYGDAYSAKAVYFDYLSFFMVYIPRMIAVVLHILPVLVFISLPLWNSGVHGGFATWCLFGKGIVFHAAAIVLGILCPVLFSIVRLFFSSYAMNWFAQPYVAFIQFIPCSLFGLLLPRVLCPNFPTLPQSPQGRKLSQSSPSSNEGRFWGSFGFYAWLSLAYFISGLNGGFLTLFVSFSLLITWLIFGSAIKTERNRSFRSSILSVLPLLPCLLYSVYFGGVLVQFVIERLGMVGAFSPPFGYYMNDVVLASVVGAVTGWCVGPLLPMWGNHLARSSILQVLLHATLLVAAFSSQLFPYSTVAPKRVVLQQSFITSGETTILDSSYELSVVDSNSLHFLFKHAPLVAGELHLTSTSAFHSANSSLRENWLGIYPVSFLFKNGMKFPAMHADALHRHRNLPFLSTTTPPSSSIDGSRRVFVELSLGALEEVWVAVLNITGRLSNWSFADQELPAPQSVDGGPPSYICRLSGAADENWTFWLEAAGTDALRVDVAVVDQVLTRGAANLKSCFPDWVDVVAFSSYMSTYFV